MPLRRLILQARAMARLAIECLIWLALLAVAWCRQVLAELWEAMVGK